MHNKKESKIFSKFFPWARPHRACIPNPIFKWGLGLVSCAPAGRGGVAGEREGEGGGFFGPLRGGDFCAHRGPVPRSGHRLVTSRHAHTTASAQAWKGWGTRFFGPLRGGDFFAHRGPVPRSGQGLANARPPLGKQFFFVSRDGLPLRRVAGIVRVPGRGGVGCPNPLFKMGDRGRDLSVRSRSSAGKDLLNLHAVHERHEVFVQD